MLVRKFVALLYSGVTVSALKLVVPGGHYVLDSPSELGYDPNHAQQNPLGASNFLSQKDAQVFEDNLENEPEAHSFKTAEDRTIYQILSDSPNFSRLVRFINISDEIVSLLNDTSAGITFFAPKLRPPHHRKPRDGFISLALSDPAAVPSDVYSALDLSEIISEIEELETALVDDPDDDPDKERRKKFIRILVRAILAYHILPQGLDVPQLVRNTTYATNLTILDGALDKEPLRIRVATSKLFPAIKINILATIVKPDIGAKNGIIHVINHPLVPPPSIFQELFLFPKYFGAVTSALQRVGLTDAVEWRYVPGEDDDKCTVEGTGAATFFVPSNIAFKKLPKKLRLFLFSPFGEKVLKKLLKFHIVPGIVLHSDYLYNATSSKIVTPDAWSDNSGNEMDFNVDENIFGYGVDKADFFDIFRHERRSAPPGYCRHSQKLHGPEYHDGCERHLYAQSDRGFCGSPHKHHHSPPPPPCQGHPHYPPSSPPSRGHHGPHDSECSTYQGDHSPYPSHKSLITRPDRVFAVNLTLPTLLTNHSLHIHIAKYKLHLPIPGHKRDIYFSTLAVNHQKVAYADVVARNGAVHIVNSVLNPRPHHRHPRKPEVVNSNKDIYDEGEDDDWEDWEDWLPQWAAEN